MITMPSSYVSQIQKGMYYSQEVWRFEPLNEHLVSVQGSTARHLLSRDLDGNWSCSCGFAVQYGKPCAHVRALESHFRPTPAPHRPEPVVATG